MEACSPLAPSQLRAPPHPVSIREALPQTSFRRNRLQIKFKERTLVLKAEDSFDRGYWLDHIRKAVQEAWPPAPRAPLAARNEPLERRALTRLTARAERQRPPPAHRSTKPPTRSAAAPTSRPAALSHLRRRAVLPAKARGTMCPLRTARTMWLTAPDPRPGAPASRREPEPNPRRRLRCGTAHARRAGGQAAHALRRDRKLHSPSAAAAASATARPADAAGGEADCEVRSISQEEWDASAAAPPPLPSKPGSGEKPATGGSRRRGAEALRDSSDDEDGLLPAARPAHAPHTPPRASRPTERTACSTEGLQAPPVGPAWVGSASATVALAAPPPPPPKPAHVRGGEPSPPLEPQHAAVLEAPQPPPVSFAPQPVPLAAVRPAAPPPLRRRPLPAPQQAVAEAPALLPGIEADSNWVSENWDD